LTAPKAAVPRRTRVCINGKFLAQPTTGVQRAARELLTALDASLAIDAAGPVLSWTVLLPPGTPAPAWRRLAVQTVPQPAGLRGLHAWEQLALPAAAAAADALLLNLSGSAPWRRPARSIAMLHDAAVFDHAEAYTWAFTRWYRALFRRLGHRACGLLTPSRYSAGRLQQVLALPPQRLRLQPLGSDHLAGVAAAPDLLRRLGVADGAPFLLAVGSRNPTKNLARVEAAFTRIAEAHPTLRLLVVGDARAAVFARGTSAPSHARILRVGRVDDAGLVALYRAATALVFPSLTEGFGLPPLEAMHAGCPVLAAKTGSLPEVCGDAAWMVDPLSVESIAGGMQALLADPDRRRALREAGFRQAARWPWADAGRALRQHVEALA
jgi:glycosyltransferase involved in cell wall biosynthesis